MRNCSRCRFLFLAPNFGVIWCQWCTVLMGIHDYVRNAIFLCWKNWSIGFHFWPCMGFFRWNLFFFVGRIGWPMVKCIQNPISGCLKLFQLIGFLFSVFVHFGLYVDFYFFRYFYSNSSLNMEFKFCLICVFRPQVFIFKIKHLW